MTEFVNKFTGEVKKRDFGTSIWRPNPDFEVHPLEESLTAPDQVEDLKTIISRCMRGEFLNIPAQKVAIEDDLSDAELAMVDGTADLADSVALVDAAIAADVANSEVAKPQESAASASDSTTTESKTESADSSESKG